MCKIMITTNDGELVEIIEVDENDLSGLPYAFLKSDIKNAIERAINKENDNDDN